MRLFKALNGDKACHGSNCRWSLPHDGQPGDWMPPITGELVPCKNGYHLCREQDLVQWLYRDIYAAEYRGEILQCEDKVVVREARLLRHYETWNERTAQLFACDCAERVAHLGDETVLRQTIAVARRYANGQATDEELATAEGAAWAASEATAWDGTEAAAESAAEAAAWAATKAAAGTAASTAAEASTWDAEREWQTARLMKYLDGK